MKALRKLSEGFLDALECLFRLGVLIAEIALVVLAYAAPIAVALLIVQKCV